MNQDNTLKILVRRVSEPCEECGSTNYPNLETNLVGIRVVLCQTCLQQEIDNVNKALKGTNQDEENAID